MHIATFSEICVAHLEAAQADLHFEHPLAMVEKIRYDCINLLSFSYVMFCETQ